MWLAQKRGAHIAKSFALSAPAAMNGNAGLIGRPLVLPQYQPCSGSGTIRGWLMLGCSTFWRNLLNADGGRTGLAIYDECVAGEVEPRHSSSASQPVQLSFSML